MDKENKQFLDADIESIKQDKQSAFKFKERRLVDWDDNYLLYRDKVVTNRLIQRQSVNVPLMKYAINTIMKDLSETPQIYYKSLDNDDQAEIYFNEYWKEASNRNNIDQVAEVDRKQALLFGRSFKKLNIENGKITMEVIDPRDMLVDRFVNPTNFDGARFIMQTGIYRILDDILNNEDYEEKGKEQLRIHYAGKDQTLAQDTTYEYNTDRDRRFATMGVMDAYTPTVSAMTIELNEVYKYEYCEEHKKNLIFVYVVAVADSSYYKLYKGRLYELLGETKDDFWHDHFPYTSWGTDIERTDFWSDGAGDVIRTPNKIVNSWMSQLVENRQLRNYGMTYYNATNPNFIPQTYTPQPFGFYPVAGNPNEVMMPVEIPDLSESLDEIQYVVGLAEKATAATATQQGVVEKQSVTLGEVQLALANAQQRVESIQKFIDEDWKELGTKFAKLTESASDMLDAVIVNKEGRLGLKVYTREISVKDWKTKMGYLAEVKMLKDKQQEDIDSIQKLQAAVGIMPNNQPLQQIYRRHILQFAGLSPDEISQVEDYEEQGGLQDNMGLDTANAIEGEMASGMETPQLQAPMEGAMMPTEEVGVMPDLTGR
jgi:hypothetical protein